MILIFLSSLFQSHLSGTSLPACSASIISHSVPFLFCSQLADLLKSVTSNRSRVYPEHLLRHTNISWLLSTIPRRLSQLQLVIDTKSEPFMTSTCSWNCLMIAAFPHLIHWYFTPRSSHFSTQCLFASLLFRVSKLQCFCLLRGNIVSVLPFLNLRMKAGCKSRCRIQVFPQWSHVLHSGLSHVPSISVSPFLG